MSKISSLDMEVFLRKFLFDMTLEATDGHVRLDSLDYVTEEHLTNWAISLADEFSKDDEVTYDNVALGWEDEQHYRLIVSIKDGKIIKSTKVSDDSLRLSKHGNVITQNHIQEYGEKYL